METASDTEEQEYSDGFNDTQSTKTKIASSSALSAEPISITSNHKCNVVYETTTRPDCIGSTVERMPATPTPPSSSPPGKRKQLPDSLPLVNIVSKVYIDTDSSTSSSYSDTPGPTLPRNGIIRRRLNNKSEMSINGGMDFEEQHQLNLTGYSTPALSSPQTPSMSSTNASTTPSSALLTSVSLASSTSAAITPATPQSLHSDLLKAQLLQWHDMPQYLQFNPYVLRGYRPLQTFRGCLLSLFYWHNETINILTHAIPIFYILAIVPGLMPWDKGYKFLSFCHIFGSVAPWCGSFVYHLFMNIEKGEKVYYTLLKMDMLGIWVSQSFGAMPLVTATTYCFTPILKWFIIISYCLLSFWGLYKALTASSPWQRRLCFALPFGMRSILTFLRIKGYVGGSHMALSHVYLQDGVSILGGAIGAMRIPEKWFPGLVDYYLNSHNIMHVLVVVAVYSMHKATIKDFEWMSTQTCNTYVSNSTNDANAEL